MSDSRKNNRIEDAGDQLVWNKKGLFKQGGLTWDDIEDENETLRLSLATKRKIWATPKWDEIIALADKENETVRRGLGMVTHMVKQVYDSLPTKPNGSTDEKIQIYIKTITEIRDACETLLNDQHLQMDVARSLGEIALNQKKGRLSVMDLHRKVEAQTDFVFKTVFPNQAMGVRWKNDQPSLDKAWQVGNKALSAMQFDVAMAVKALKAMDKGWPGKQEMWQKRGITISQIDERATAHSYEHKGSHSSILHVPIDERYTCAVILSSTTSEEESLKQAEQYRALNAGSFVVANFQRVFLSMHKTREEAVEAAREKARPKRQGRTKSGPGASADEIALVRNGPDILAPGEEITPERLMNTFGLRGVNFGNWVNQEERRFFLNNAYVSLMDLSRIIGLEPQDMGLGKMLGIAFGAQGSGSAAAHFIAGANEINMTKTKGVGALAHEWGHAMDHYLAKMTGLSRGERAYASWLPDYRRIPGEPVLGNEACDLIKDVTNAMREYTESPEEAFKRAESFAHECKDAFDLMMKNAGFDSMDLSDRAEQALEKIQNLDLGEPVNWKPKPPKRKPLATLPENILILCQETEMQPQWAKQLSGCIGVYSRFVNAESKPPQMKQKTQYFEASISADKGKTGVKDAYWCSNHEMFARAFEAWTKDTLAENQIRNDFLTICPSSKIEESDPNFPYPAGKDREAINTAITKMLGHPEIIAAIKKDSPEPWAPDIHEADNKPEPAEMAAAKKPRVQPETSNKAQPEPEREQTEIRPVTGSQQDLFL